MVEQTSSADRFMGKSVIYGKADEYRTPYMTRYWFGRLRLHIFRRGDQDEDCHDHPWDFWTFPFHSYVEEVVHDLTGEQATRYGEPFTITNGRYRARQIVQRFRWTFRPATHTHRVLGRAHPYDGLDYEGQIVTIVWRSAPKREWGFLKNRDGLWCWTPWKEYVFGGGKNAPCE